MAATRLLAPTAEYPWLLYGAPWLPYPRKVFLYLREKAIHLNNQVVVVHGANAHNFPSRPQGSVPMLAIPATPPPSVKYTYVRQSNSIIHLLEQHCNNNLLGFTAPHGPMNGANKSILEQARMNELQTLADELMVAWNPVRLFGTEAGPISIPAAAKESLRWITRTLATIERWWQEEDRSMSVFQRGVHGHVTTAEISLYCFLEFARDGYGVDLTKGSGEDRPDVYGRMVSENFPKLREFFETFSKRESASRSVETGDIVSEQHRRNMSTWAAGVL